jgi:hypothetical protein
MKICIVCQKDMEGKPTAAVKDDAIIRAIRRVKQSLNMAQNNELCVCEADVPAHEKRRREFERSLVLFGVLAAVVVILLVATLVMSGRFDIVAFLSALLIGLFILLFAIVFKYAPALELGPGQGGGKPKLPPELEELEGKEKQAPAAAKAGKPGKKR